MTFRFAARNLETGKTVTLNVTGAREMEARRKLQLGGYEVLHLIRAVNGVDHGVKLFAPAHEAWLAASGSLAQPPRSSLLGIAVARLQAMLLGR